MEHPTGRASADAPVSHAAFDVEPGWERGRSGCSMLSTNSSLQKTTYRGPSTTRCSQLPTSNSARRILTPSASHVGADIAADGELVWVREFHFFHEDRPA